MWWMPTQNSLCINAIEYDNIRLLLTVNLIKMCPNISFDVSIIEKKELWILFNNFSVQYKVSKISD